MGTKISALTTTGSAPTDSYVPIAYDGQNYKATSANFLASNEISFRADLNGSNQSVGSATETQLQFTNAVFNEGSKYDPSTYLFTPGVAGRYLLTANAAIDRQNFGQFQINIRKNGTSIAYAVIRGYTNNMDNTLGVTIIVQANDTDYFDVSVWSSDTKNIFGYTNQTWFAGCRV